VGNVRFGYSVTASRLHDPATVDALTSPVRRLLDELGGAPLDDEASALDQPDVHVAVVATGGTEQLLIADGEDRRRERPWLPTVLVAHGAHNSLPAALEALAAIQQSGGRGRIVALTGDAATDLPMLDDAVGDLEAVVRMHTMRLGVIGGPSSWLVASNPEPEVVRRRWGPEVITVDPTRMIELTRTPTAPGGALAERFTSVADPVRVDRGAVDGAVAVRAALADALDDDHLDAVTVRCFDLLDDPGTSGCLAVASLNDDGIVAGCEGDVPSALAMAWVRAVLDQPTWMANPAALDAQAERVVLAHCTVAPSMVQTMGLDTHFESGRGVGIGGTFALQPVTLIRLGGVDLDRCWIAEGDIVATGDDRHLCRTQVTVALSDGHVSDLLEQPLGNHLVLAAGHHGERLRRWFQFAVAD